MINRNSTSSWNKMTSNSKNNMVKITDQFNVAEKFKLINCEKKCFALRDFVGLYSENINLIKVFHNFKTFTSGYLSIFFNCI